MTVNEFLVRAGVKETFSHCRKIERAHIFSLERLLDARIHIIL